MKDYERIANLVISLTETDIFENRKTQKHVDSRAFFHEIKQRRPEFNTWQRIIEQTTVSQEDLLSIMEKINSLTDIKSIEKVVDILDVLRDQELEQKESFLKTI